MNATAEQLASLGPVRHPLATVVPMTLVYTVILVTGVTGNACTCLVIARNRSMRTATNFYLLSLAVSDLLLLVLGLPQEMYELWVRYPYAFGAAMCVFRGLISETSTNASILTIAAFTVERYFAICHPLRALRGTASQPCRVIAAVWVLAAIGAVPLAVQFGLLTTAGLPGTERCTVKSPLPHSFTVSTAVFFLLPMTAISYLYVAIGLKLRRSVSRASTNGSVHKNPGAITSGGSRRAVVKMLVAVVVAFFVCWAPFHAQRLMATYVTKPSPADIALYNVLTYISGVTYYVSATINPILYSILSLKFRKAFADTLAGCCGRGTARDRRRSRATLSSASRLPRKIVSTGGSSSFADDEIRKLKSTL